MAEYLYKAQNSKGKIVKGRKNASSELELHNLLLQENSYLLSYTALKKKEFTRTLSTEDLAAYCRELGTLLDSGITLVKALSIMSKEEQLSEKNKKVYLSILHEVTLGIPLSNAMANRGNAFPSLLVNMIKASEESGDLAKNCKRMADHFSKNAKFEAKVKSATTYPKILLILTIAVVIILMAFVMPMFADMFAEMESLPLATTILFAISDYISNNAVAVIFFAVVIFILYKLLSEMETLSYRKDRLLLKLPYISNLERVIFTARFGRTLSTLYACGMPIVNALKLARDTIGNKYIEKQFDSAVSLIRTGESLSSSLMTIDGFTKKLSSTIKVGEETGKLDSMLTSMSDDLDYESEMATDRLLSYLEPAMIVVMALIVGFIMIAVIQPIYGSYGSIGGGVM